jgi:hypothetical protein
MFLLHQWQAERHAQRIAAGFIGSTVLSRPPVPSINGRLAVYSPNRLRYTYQRSGSCTISPFTSGFPIMIYTSVRT